MITIARERTPQRLLNLGNLSLAKYQVTGNNRADRNMINSLNKISIAQHRGSR